MLIELGKTIREYRIKTGLSQESFALKIDMDRAYYASIENGKHNVSILKLKKIADGLGISLATLLRKIG